MTFTQRFISPKLPTTLVNDTHVDLPGYDVWFLYVNNVHIVPIELDVSKFEDALSRVLQLYPHAAGRLRCVDGRWFIELTNSAVPLDIDYKLGVDCDSLLDGDWVSQCDLSPLLQHQRPIDDNLINGSASLLRLKITVFNHETCIGISWNHSLGDGITMLRFMHTLSQFYQELPPEFAPPSFKKRHFPPLSHPILTERSPRVPLLSSRRANEATCVDLHKGVGNVKWRIDTYDLQELRSVLCSDMQNKKLLSKQDCLIAYLVAVLNCNQVNPVKKVRNLVSYRHISASFVTENVASNLILDVPIDVPTNMAGIAAAVRDALIRSREPEYIYHRVMLRSKLMHERAKSRKPLPFPLDDDELVVNSTTVIDWCGANFGCPDGTRFYTEGVGKHFLRCFRSNPTKGADGAWQARQSIEISMGVPVELQPKILETLTRGVQYILDNRL